MFQWDKDSPEQDQALAEAIQELAKRDPKASGTDWTKQDLEGLANS
jgi:hypothetical protein